MLSETSTETESDHIESGPPAIVDEGTREDYARFVTQAGIRDAMTIDNFLNPVEEEEVLRKIEMIDEEEWIVESAQTVQIDEE